MSQEPNTNNLSGRDSPHFSAEVDSAEIAAWTEVEAGRFMPRRVRGSFQGRALGWVFTLVSSGSDDAQCQDKQWKKVS